jgi:hypothetical protein
MKDTITIQLDRSSGHIIVTSAAGNEQSEQDVARWFGDLMTQQIKANGDGDIRFDVAPYTLWHEYARAVAVVRECKFKPTHGRRYRDGWLIYVDKPIDVAQATVENHLKKAGAQLRGYGWDNRGGHHLWFDLKSLGVVAT